MVTVRDAAPADLDALVTLNDRYMRETYGRPWNGTRARLEHDLFVDRVVEIAIAERGESIGFVGWYRAYDLHHCIRGASVGDLYVEPAWRGHGVALRLMTFCAARVHATGGTYLHGTAAGELGGPLYARAAEGGNTDTFTLGGRAFREVAALDGLPPRQVLRRLPPLAANREP